MGIIKILSLFTVLSSIFVRSAFSQGTRVLTGKISKTIIENLERSEEIITTSFYDTREKKHYIISDNLKTLLDIGSKSKIRINARYDRKTKTLKALQDKGKKKSKPLFRVLASNIDTAVNGEKSVLVITGSFRDKDLPCSQENVQEVYFGTNEPGSVSDVLKKTSENRLNLSGTVVGPYQIPFVAFEYNCNNYEQIKKILLQKAKTAGINENQYDYVSFVFPAQCSYVGIAEIGGRYTWNHVCNSARTPLHELGHNFGMFHATSLISISGQNPEYADLSDFMGQYLSYLNSPHISQMQWNTSAEIQDITRSGNFSLKPLFGGSTSVTAPRMVRISTPELSKPLYVSYRNSSAPVSFIDSRFNSKVSIHEYSGGETRTRLLALLNEGDTYQEPDTGYLIKFKTLSPQRVDLSLDVPCVKKRPEVLINPTSSATNTPTGTSFSYQLSIKNNDTAVCTPSNFTIDFKSEEGIVPAGFPKQATLSAGETINYSIQFNSPSGIHDGFYSFLVGAIDGVNHQSLTGYGAGQYSVSGSGYKTTLPQVGIGGVVSSANYLSTSLAPGALITIFGSNLSGGSQICRSDSTPYPSNLCNTQVFLNKDISIPLSFVSPYQINAQLPYEAQTLGSSTLTIVVNSKLMYIPIYFQKIAPAIFTKSENNKTLAIAQHVSDSREVTRTSPARLREYVSLYLTGLGASTPSAETGEENSGPYSSIAPFEVVFIGSKSQLNIRRGVFYSGRAPGYVGLDQINIQIPKELLSDLSTTELLNMIIQICPLGVPTNSSNCSNSVNLPLAEEE